MERTFITKKMKSDKSELLVIYGRRRVGKTFLLEKSFDSPIYFTADLSNPNHLMNSFVEPLKEMLNLPYGLTISGWDEFFQLLANAIKKMKGKQAIIFDEFQYIPQRDDSFMSIFQKWWDKEFSKLPVLIVLCGSFIGMIERIALSSNSPLYGRRTGQYLIRPMNYFDSSLFLKKMNTEERIKTYSVTGGIPLYLNEFRNYFSFEKALKEKILSPGEFLLEEGRFTTLEQFSRDSGSYFDILRVVANGRTKPNEISTLTGIPHNGIGTYLSKLVDLRLLKKEMPFSLKKPRKSPFYYIDDDYLRFYFKYLYPHKELVYREKGDVLSSLILKTFTEFVSFTYEKVAIQYLEETVGPEKIGRWWKKNEEIDIDIVATRGNNLYVCEVKWSNKPIDNKVLQKLQRKTGLLLEDLNGNFESITYCLFSKSGFEGLSPQKNLLMVSLNDIEKQTKKHY
jgi:hypothetical protein